MKVGKNWNNYIEKKGNKEKYKLNMSHVYSLIKMYITIIWKGDPNVYILRIQTDFPKCKKETNKLSNKMTKPKYYN